MTLNEYKFKNLYMHDYIICYTIIKWVIYNKNDFIHVVIYTKLV